MASIALKACTSFFFFQSEKMTQDTVYKISGLTVYIFTDYPALDSGVV